MVPTATYGLSYVMVTCVCLSEHKKPDIWPLRSNKASLFKIFFLENILAKLNIIKFESS